MNPKVKTLMLSALAALIAAAAWQVFKDTKKAGVTNGA